MRQNDSSVAEGAQGQDGLNAAAAPGTRPTATPPGASDGAPQQNGTTSTPPAPTQSGQGQENGKTSDDKKKQRPPWVKPVALVVGLVALIYAGIWGLNYWRFAQSHVATDDAYLTSDIVQITPQVNGNIMHVYVSENQQVKAGQLLVDLDDATFRADVAQAQANLDVARATASGAGTSVELTTSTGNAQIQQAQGGLVQAESGIGAARADAERFRAAIGTALANLQAARSGVNTAQAALNAARVARRRALEAVRGAQAQVVTAQAGVRTAQANVAAAQANADKSAKDQQRYAVLYSQDAVSAQQVDLVTAQATSARAQLDSAQQAVAQAQSVVIQRQSDLAATQEAVSTADANIAQAASQVASARDAVTAAQATVQQSQAQYLAAQQNITGAEAKRQQAAGQLNQARTAPQQVTVQQANQKTATARIPQAQAALLTAQINLKRTKIYAPCDGMISKKTAEIGQQVAVGQALMAVIPNNDVWVEANFKETQLTNVRPGQPVDVDVDAFPGRKFTGKVNSIAAGTGATFALLPPDNSTGNFTKVVQRVPVKILFDPGQKGLDQLRAGLSVVATIQTK